MTLSEILDLARDTLAKRAIMPARETDLAQAVLDLLAEDQPCGFDAPLVEKSDPLISVPDYSGMVSPDDARAIARMLLRAADLCDADGDGE